MHVIFYADLSTDEPAFFIHTDSLLVIFWLNKRNLTMVYFGGKLEP